MVPFLPKTIANRAIAIYVTSLCLVSFFFMEYRMLWGYVVLGVACVLGFFVFTNHWSEGWRKFSEKRYLKYLFWTALGIRLVWVVVSYYYYTALTGQPFEFGAADSIGYHDEAVWLADSDWPFVLDYYFGGIGVSDVGYPLLLTILYKIIGPSIIVPRIIKAFISAYTCVLLYRLSQRTFGEDTARIIGIMSALMLNLIIYCGYHLKETEMLFLEVAFLERADYLFRSRKGTFWNIFLPSMLAISMFFFRTVLGTVAIFSLVTAILFMNTPSMKRGWKRVTLICWGLV